MMNMNAPLSHRVLGLALAAVILTSAHAQRRALIIGIDGCRPDALVLANTPNIDGLMATSVYTLEGNTHPPTISGPGWSSMLCGVWEQKHGVKDNTFVGSQYATWPHFFDRLQALDPSLYIASICHWSPINTMILSSADLEQNFATDAEVATAAVNLLSNGDPDLLFLHFDNVDGAGHANGHVPTSPTYIAAIEGVDALVGDVLAALATRPAMEEWMVCVVTDHGGNANGHGGITPEEQRIFRIVSAPYLDPHEIKAKRDTLSAPTSIFLNNVGHVRVANAAAYQFGTAQDFTIECRVKMPTTWTGDPAFVSNKNWNSGVNAGFVLSTTLPGGTTWKINIGDGVDRVDLTGLPINDNQWHHLAMTCDRNGMVRIFQDGLYLGEASMAAIGNVNTALQLCFGQDGTTTYGSAMPGNIAEVRIWNAALDINTVSDWSGKQINATHPNAASLIGHWEMDEGAGTVLANNVAGGSVANYFGTGPTWQTGTGHVISTDLSRTPAQVDLPPTVLAHLCIAEDPAWQWDGRSMIPVCAPMSVPLRTFLKGPYDTVAQMMHDSLRTHGLIPVQEPFTALGFAHAGNGGNEQLVPSSLTVSGPNAIVDWVLMELRDPLDSVTLVATRSLLVQRDGDVVDMNGTSAPQFTLEEGEYFVTVRHRNHLGMMTAAPVTITAPGISVIDFTLPGTALYGTAAMSTNGGVRTQWSGNVVRDGSLRYTGASNDRDPIL
ncbi:MAG: alkaline phosphatase family protein, partial [Flavobacteriales bacterium]